ncbi:MAG TPA: hypothetical protein VFT29_07905, partial [Gemmatimonadaceae bacterium]|nr:hypothetical protein [Gemmatimonadaceae bacterium]
MLQFLILAFGFASLIGCGREPQARADTPTSESVNGDVGQSVDSAAKRRKAEADLTIRDTSGVITVKVPPGRPKKDSLALVSAVRVGLRTPGWPVKGPAPEEGAIIPNKRIVAFYGNPLSKRMGILGALPPGQMLTKLDAVVTEWERADPDTPVQPALHYIAVVAQAGAGRDGKYRLRMDSSAIEQVYEWAQQRNAILFLDIQTGLSTVKEELPHLMKFL